MPTYNRGRFVPHAIEYFLCQDYKSKELIVVDDGTDPVADLIPDDPSVHYIRLEQRLTVGAKRNLACAQARGEIIAHWDDDDWHSPHRINYQVEHLLRAKAQVCGISKLLFYDIVNKQAWQYTYPVGHRFWLSGSTLCYRRSFWGRHKFSAVNVGEDARFVWSGQHRHMITLPDSNFHVGIIHGENVSPKKMDGIYWASIPVKMIQQLLDIDWHYYQ